jgi:hypothetical protein
MFVVGRSVGRRMVAYPTSGFHGLMVSLGNARDVKATNTILKKMVKR